MNSGVLKAAYGACFSKKDHFEKLKKLYPGNLFVHFVYDDTIYLLPCPTLIINPYILTTCK